MKELRCTACHETFSEDEAIGERCPFCFGDSLFEREVEEDFSDAELAGALDLMATDIWGKV
jgi:predicted  nucleic acid-binding Zn-ribbon protein